MTGRVAIITGATKGIGYGVAKRLITNGVNIATIYHRDDKAADRLRSDGEAAAVSTLIAKHDVTAFSALTDFTASVLREFGRIDYLINNVGFDIFKPVVELTFEEWRLSQDVILNAPFILSKAVLPVMRRQGNGRIVNIGASSKDYLKGAPGLTAFGVHKGALALLTKSLALEEISHGITVNMVAPGSTKDAGTLPEEQRIPVGSIPLGRRVEIEEVVEAVMYFLSDKAGSVTGQCIGVNGGLST
ncbi:MAG: Enoyl-(acyl-carrier-protein) reductase (NADPH) FabL [Syntrophorhabdus sp. PtaU1.Bin050]|nr:MAG: Enoyl-(acyl-carrier-protein) reductase (NADPH) FabL [Syntrophorhabdus sp. PtaU1.Bin050]